MRIKLQATVFTVLCLSLFTSSVGHAATEFFGSAKIKPTLYDNFDFDDSKKDAPALNEGGWAAGEHIRAELRLGWKASGEKWKIKMIAEADVIYNKDNADRSFYVGAEKDDQPNAGGEFGIERGEFVYTFLPQLELETGWDVRYLDIRSGGLLYGDDHPFIGFRGALAEKLRYELLYLPIQNREKIGVSDSPKTGDWRVYSLKLGYDLGEKVDGSPMSPFYAERRIGMTLSPFLAFSDNTDKEAEVGYYGLEATGQAGPVKPYLEIVGADGEFDRGPDIRSWAWFAGLEVPVSKAFTPYAAFRFTQGDDDKNDDKAEGFVGITDIARFTPLLGMDGNILGEHLASGASIYNSPLYSYSPDRAVGGNVYGGIGNASSGNNPGQKLLAVGARGDLSDFIPNVLYKAQAFFIWYDETGNLVNVRNPEKSVDDYAGTTFDLQVLWAASKNFSIDYIFSTFVPGDGIKEQVDANDPAMLHALTLAWAY